MIRFYRLGARNEFIQSQIPQKTLDEYVNGLPVRVDLSQVVNASGVTISSLNIVYDGYSLPTRLREAGYTYQLDDKYGAVELPGGFIYLGVKSED